MASHMTNTPTTDRTPAPRDAQPTPRPDPKAPTPQTYRFEDFASI